MPVEFLAVVALLVLIAAAALQRRMMKAAQPARLQLAEIGERLLARKDLPESMREDVQEMLDDAFPSIHPVVIFIMIVLSPLVLLFVLSGVRERDQSFKRAPTEARRLYLEMLSLHRRISLANHPILTPLGELVISLTIVFIAPILAVMRRSSWTSVNRDYAHLVVERRQRMALASPAKAGLKRAW